MEGVVMIKRMTPEEIEYYKKQVDRRGNALKKSEEVRQKYAAEFEKINAYLVNNWKQFAISNTIRRMRYFDREVWDAFIEQETDRFIAYALKARNDGDFENFCWFAWLMHLKYMTMWREKHG